MSFMRDQNQSRHRLGSMIELCVCGAEFIAHGRDGECPLPMKYSTTDNTKENSDGDDNVQPAPVSVRV